MFLFTTVSAVVAAAAMFACVCVCVCETRWGLPTQRGVPALPRRGARRAGLAPGERAVRRGRRGPERLGRLGSGREVQGLRGRLLLSGGEGGGRARRSEEFITTTRLSQTIEI